MNLRLSLLQILVNLSRNGGFECPPQTVFFLGGLDAGGGWTKIGGATHACLDREFVRRVQTHDAEQFGFRGNFAATETAAIVWEHGFMLYKVRKGDGVSMKFALSPFLSILKLELAALRVRVLELEWLQSPRPRSIHPHTHQLADEIDDGTRSQKQSSRLPHRHRICGCL